MEIFTLDDVLQRRDVIEEFSSAIWTERYYGDSDVEIVVPLKSDSINKLLPGTFVTLTGSQEVMLIETQEIDDGVKCTGISLLPWLNNRFVRTSDTHKDRTWYLNQMPAGKILWTMIHDMCVAGSKYLDGTISIGIPVRYTKQLIIPGLGLHSYDSTGGNVQVAIPFGPLYDAMREVAVTYQLGQQIIQETGKTTPLLGYRNYRGLNRTHTQLINPLVRFSPFFDSLINVKELHSNAAQKTMAFAFASQADDTLGGVGVAYLKGADYKGFKLRALEVLVDGIDVNIPDSAVLKTLSDKAKAALRENKYIEAVAGEIVSTNMFKYGIDYNLGDLVELQGNNQAISFARVTEYIRAQSSTGERSYPTVEVIDDINTVIS